jgi:glycosyltransferase involved in cell wall biosynthesis
MKIAAMLRVKNEARWITDVIASIRELCAEIIVLDDHSTDDTAALASAAGAKVIESPFELLDESRDKNFLLTLVSEKCPDWVLCIDGDEVLEPGEYNHYKVVPLILNRARWDAYSLWIRYLWDSPSQIRTDGIYRKFSRPSLFRLKRGQAFRNTRYGGNLHCGNVPDFMRGELLPVSLLHYGYMHREDRIRKYEWYNTVDPKNPFEDGYRHMVIGDIFPAESKFRHAGPLKLEAYGKTV